MTRLRLRDSLRTVAAVALAAWTAAAAAGEIRIEPIPGQAQLGTVEIHGVGAGPFDARLWQAGTQHILPDARTPLLRPRIAGVFRNIYAPSAVELPEGWRLFYGAWDGVDTGNDRIYSVSTADFLDFGARTTVIEHGTFVHVCNVNALRLPDGSFHMVCTVYPDAGGRNKIAAFSSPDGWTWSGGLSPPARAPGASGPVRQPSSGPPAPYAPGPDDIITLEGYAGLADADMNGMNVLLHEDSVWRLYFGDFRQHTHVRRASSHDGRRFSFDGPCLATRHMVNDVKKLEAADGPWYLMGLHANTGRLWYALSQDGLRFDAERELAASLGDADRYIVALGWVVREGRLLGYVYGAGPVSELNRNQIFARWLQKKLVFTDDDGGHLAPTAALGPDRQILPLPPGTQRAGRVQLLAEDGTTPLAAPLPVTLVSGAVYRVHTGDERK